ncbi:hypothetical protein VIOR3934_08089 [Vibrio orientalis CIP 102891 = ATCC 33934]|uniref:Uncharacterized protein n=1 Tax=Vibrio orientalis CIP 102891 = ATCC 33934 TaxID=675816 RepID=C9QG46_VIBOR|nr:hypothetical protein [Vibrio orientalis]EEX94546.1 hypothetical protein VIA_001706 [Vibrio orientalis CIP 102891 = ATCC 33934]EGU50402.1 hypothetical protein VIOR3934_08089 [Vibrio orientalis CIP 102891 = ATCC 33934]
MSLLLLSTALIASTDSTLKYQIEPTSTGHDAVTVSVETNSLGTFHALPARTLANDTQPTLFCVTANGSQTAIEYQTPIQCDHVTWQLPLAAIGKDGFDIAKQIDSYEPIKGWSFVSEFNSLPRFATHNDELIPAQVCSPDNQCGWMPDADRPPLFVVWGLKPVELNINGKTIKVTTDTEQILQTMDDWKPALESQLNYLISLFPDSSVNQWDIAFFSRDKQAGSVSGAAGSNKILINAILDNGQFEDDEMPMLLKIAAHESMHLLDTSSPLWASESLAEYYAIKSLDKTQYKFTDPKAQWDGFAQSFPFASTGLFEASNLVSTEQQYQYYPLFYVKGPAFWQALDQSLMDKGESLDSRLPTLTYNKDGSLSEASIGELTKIIGKKKWDELTKLYL